MEASPTEPCSPVWDDQRLHRKATACRALTAVGAVFARRDAPVPANLAQQQCDIRFDGETPSSAGWTAIEVVRSMGDRFEAWPTSGFVKAVTAMVAAAPTEAFTLYWHASCSPRGLRFAH